MSSIRGNSLLSLTGMRFVAAALVAAFHIGNIVPFADPDVTSGVRSLFGQGGWAGVTFFFVLSGFVLTWAVRPTDTLTGFWRRRFFKVFPNHVVVLLAGVVLLIHLDAFPGLGVTVANLFLVHAWDWRLTSWWGVNPVSWSLCCEVFFYASFPLIIRLVNRVRAGRLWMWVAGITAAIVAVPSLAGAILPDEPVTPAMPIGVTELWFVNGFAPVRTLDFLLGIFLARMVREGRLFRLPLSLALALALAAYVTSTQVPPVYGLAACTSLPFGLLIASAAQADRQERWSPFRGRTMVWLGQISFAFYLWHYLLLMWFADLFYPDGDPLSTAGDVGVLALALGSAVLISWATFRWVETPAMRYFASSRSGRRDGAEEGKEERPLADSIERGQR
ncbi:acyltransferase family protein [Streptomyces sp. NPDC056909]|uniref:acyltransferase family protein n=2 Tax=unclassified Streptomyces TaxID=2593676 RepID=UPI003691FF5B